MKITAQEGQTLLDVAVRECGGIEGVFALAERNGIPITDRLEPGQVIEIAPEDVVNKEIAEYYSTRNILPATEPDIP